MEEEVLDLLEILVVPPREVKQPQELLILEPEVEERELVMLKVDKMVGLE
jgi:hypothetical protein